MRSLQQSIKVPLHLARSDETIDAWRLRLVLHAHMAQLNPKGWRLPRTSRKRMHAQPIPRTWQQSAWVLARLPTQSS